MCLCNVSGYIPVRTIFPHCILHMIKSNDHSQFILHPHHTFSFIFVPLIASSSPSSGCSFANCDRVLQVIYRNNDNRIIVSALTLDYPNPKMDYYLYLSGFGSGLFCHYSSLSLTLCVLQCFLGSVLCCTGEKRHM